MLIQQSAVALRKNWNKKTLNGFENPVKEKERKKKQKEKESLKKDASSIDCATEEPDEFQAFDDCSDEDEIWPSGNIVPLLCRGLKRERNSRIDQDAVIALQKDCELSEISACIQESIEDSPHRCLKHWCCDQCSLDLEYCRFDHRSDSEPLPHALRKMVRQLVLPSKPLVELA